MAPLTTSTLKEDISPNNGGDFFTEDLDQPLKVVEKASDLLLLLRQQKRRRKGQ
jgi:hypothetical protein